MKYPDALDTLLESLPEDTEVEVRGQGQTGVAKWIVAFSVEVPDTSVVVRIAGEGDKPDTAATEAWGLWEEFQRDPDEVMPGITKTDLARAMTGSPPDEEAAKEGDDGDEQGQQKNDAER
jgi:hypothetical protein